MSPATRVLVWNAERKSPRGAVGARIHAFLAGHAPDLILLTEGEVGLLPPGGHTITARPLPGDHLRANERRVLAWSRAPWTDVEDYADLEALRLPGSGDPEGDDGTTAPRPLGPDVPEDPRATLPGRLVSGTTTTALGPVRVHAMCIPWSFSRVQWSDVKRRPWQDHLAFLEALAPILATGSPARDGGTVISGPPRGARLPADLPTLIGGDFNQCVPRTKGQPHQPSELLTALLGPPAWSIVTAGANAPFVAKSGEQPIHRPLIDHLALSAALTATAVEGTPNHDHDGRRLSDHTGCVVTVARA